MLDRFELVDLTHTITTSIPSWQGTASFSFTIIKDYHQGNRTQQFNIASNTGTHIDSPGHFHKDAKTVDSIPLSKLIVPAFVLNVSNKINDHYRVSEVDLEEFEKKYGNIPAQSLVIIHTGWCTRWNEHQKYRNLDENGIMHFPGLSEGIAHAFVERNIAGIAIDTFSPDGSDYNFPVHKILLSKGIYIIENITNGDKLPPTGAFAAALPIKIYDAVEAPIRIVGFIPKKN